MKALSIRQPWAWLIAHGHKDIENRTWHTNHRGPFLIHAGQRFDLQGYEWVKENFPQINMPAPDKFERGGIVGDAWIYGLTKYHNSPWFEGPHGFLIVDPRPLKFQPLKGKLGFFTVNQ